MAKNPASQDLIWIVLLDRCLRKSARNNLEQLKIKGGWIVKEEAVGRRRTGGRVLKLPLWRLHCLFDTCVSVHCPAFGAFPLLCCRGRSLSTPNIYCIPVAEESCHTTLHEQWIILLIPWLLQSCVTFSSAFPLDVPIHLKTPLCYFSSCFKTFLGIGIFSSFSTLLDLKGCIVTKLEFGRGIFWLISWSGWPKGMQL